MSMDDLKNYDNVVTAMATIDAAETARWLKLFAESITYQGFDPSRTLEELFKRAVILKKNKAGFLSDILQILTFYVIGGTNFDRATEKWVNPEAKKTVVDIMGAYGITKNLQGGSGPEKVSLARVALVFTEVISALLESGVGRPIVSKTGLPVRFSYPGGCTLMTDDEWNLLKDHYLDMMVDFSLVVSRKKTEKESGSTVGKTKQELRLMQQQYADIGRNSAFSVTHRTTKRKSFNTMTVTFLATAEALGRKNPNPARMEVV